MAVFGAQDNDARFADTLALANWYYSHIVEVPIINTPVVRNGVPLVGEAACFAWCDRTAAVTIKDPKTTFSVFSLGGELEQTISYDELNGAVEQGATVGSISFKQHNATVAQAELVAAESVAAPNPLEWLLVQFDRLVRRFKGEPLTAETLTLNEAPNVLELDAWGAA